MYADLGSSAIILRCTGSFYGVGKLSHAIALQGMVWLGQSLVMATSLRYVLFNPQTKACTELFSVSPEAPPPTMVQSVPSADEAILLMVRHNLQFVPSYPTSISQDLMLSQLWQPFMKQACCMSAQVMSRPCC